MNKIDINKFISENDIIESSIDKLKEINGGCEGTCVIQIGRCLNGGYYY